MYRSFFQRFFSVALLAALFSLNACQKDVDLTSTTTTTEGIAGERNQLFYGVTIYGGPATPSRVVEIDQNTGFPTGNNFVPFITVLGNQLPIEDITGICYLGGGIKYAIMTGQNTTNVPANSLMTLNIATGEAFFVSTSTVGPVSDIDYDPISGNVYGLQGNSLVTISGGGLNNYAVTPLQGLTAGHSARGLTMIGDVNQGATQINISTTSTGFFASTEARKVDPNTGITGLIGTLLPGNELNGGNCSLSYQLQPNSQLYISRNGTGIAGSGLNNTFWPSQGAIPTANWGANGFNFGDLSSDVGI